MRFKQIALTVGLVVAAGLPTAGTAAAAQETAAGRITATGYGLNAVDVATGAVTELQSGWTTPLSGIQGPVFSPDGARITFSAMDDVDHSHRTYVVDAADGRNLRTLTDQAVIPTDWLSR